MTLEGLARALKKPLKVDETALSWVNARYKELLRKGWITKLEMTPSRIKMAKLPLTSKPLHNPIGTAPGVLLREGDTKIICLPGVPKELEAIFKDSVKKEILKEIGVRCFLESNFIVKGIGESAMASTIEEVMERYSPYVYIKSHPKYRARASDVTVEFNLTTTYDLKSHKKGRVFLERKIKEAQQDLEKGVKKLGGKIEH